MMLLLKAKRRIQSHSSRCDVLEFGRILKSSDLSTHMI